MVMETQRAGGSSSKDAEVYYRLVTQGPRKEHPYVVLLGLRTFETPSLLRRIDEGLSYRAFKRFQRNIYLTNSGLAELVQISTRTLNRRKHAGRLEPDESDRLVRISRVYGKALELFEGDDEAARAWIARKQVGLGGAAPLELLKSEVGAREVENLIGRLEHGVFS
jgi:putative toxin-antitoxin system antitoxin component (TIGR02293 family)